MTSSLSDERSSAVFSAYGYGSLMCSAILCYTFFVAFYRLYWSPVAKFPGPRLAALTLWYEFYFDVVQVCTSIWSE